MVCVGFASVYTDILLSVDLLRRLKPIQFAWYDSAGSPKGCFRGTRESLLRDIMNWFAADDERPVYWLKGLAGTGKTTVARSVAELAAKQGSLGATFFFSRTDTSRQNPLAVIPTLAYRLARWRLELRDPICAAVKVYPDIAYSDSVEEQGQHLLSEALSTLSLPVPRVLIVLDALDECDKVNNVEGGKLLPVLFDCLGSLPLTVKILVTSRDERSIRGMFATERTDHPMQVLASHADIEAHIVEADIALYFTHELGRIGKDKGDDSWPSPEDVDKLVHRAGTLFVYAATVVKYIETRSDFYSYKDLLAQVLVGDLREAGELDWLYLQILMYASSYGTPGYSEEKRILVLEMVASLMLLQEPLSADAIAGLVDKPRDLVGRLESVLWKSDDGTVRLFHPSFADFVGDEKRCTNLSFPTKEPKVTGVSFLVLPEEHHHRLARRCLALMNRHLEHDIGELEKPLIRNNEIVALRGKIDLCAPHIHELRYACKS
jgi:hypothetical protein